MITNNVTSDNRPPYTVTGLIKGTATLDEIRTLLLNWQPDEEPREYAARVQQEGIITKQTSKRVQDLVLRVFQPWFLLPDNRAVSRLQSIVKAGIDQRKLKELIFLYKARSESVLYDYVLEEFWPSCLDGALYLRTQDIEDFLREALENGRTSGDWSQNTQGRLARGILQALSIVGFIREEKRYLYEFVLYQVSDFTLIYLIYDLHFHELTDNAIFGHPDWGLFGLDRFQVLDRLSRLDERAGLIIQQAGSVVQVTWLHKSMEEVIDAYFG